MKPMNIPIDQIVPNPWRDMDLYPIDKLHVNELRASIKQHGFFGGMKGRRCNGVVELGCGHHRLEAARKENMESLLIFIGDMTDDEMILLMADENATQAGHSGAAVLSDVAAVMRRLVAILLDQTGTFAPIGAKVFDGKVGFGTARGKLLAGMRDPNKDGGLGWSVIQRYLNHSKESKVSQELHSKRQIIEAITSLKQSGRYDEIIINEIAKYPQLTNSPPAKGKAVIANPVRRQKIYDDRCTAVFPVDHQAQAFREAITTEGARQYIPVSQQLTIAKKLMDPEEHKQWSKRQQGAPYIKRAIKNIVEDASMAQRKINKEERERFLREQQEGRIDSELHSAHASIRSLLSAIGRMSELADEFPHHPKIGGFGAKLDQLAKAIQVFSKKLNK